MFIILLQIEAGSGGRGGFFSNGLLVRRVAGRFLQGTTQGGCPANAGAHPARGDFPNPGGR